MGGKGKGKGGPSAGRSKAVEAGGSSPKVMAAAGPTGSLALKEVLASSAEAPGDVKLKAKAAARPRDLKLKAKAAAADDEFNSKQSDLKLKAKAAAVDDEVNSKQSDLKLKAKEAVAADDLANSKLAALKIKAKAAAAAAAANDEVNSKQAALKIKTKAAAVDDLVDSKQPALKIKAKSSAVAAPVSLKTKVKEAAAAGKIKKSGVPKATLKSRLSVVAEADKSEGEEEHGPDEEAEDDSEEDPDYDPEDDSEEDPDYDPEEDSDGDDPDDDDSEPDEDDPEPDDDFDIVNTVAELRALLAQGPIVRGIRVEHVPSTHQAADLYDALFEVEMPPGMSIANMEPLRHLKPGRERVLTDILSGSILRLRNRPHSQTTKARLRRQARSLKGTARAVRGDFRARAEDVADQLTAFANRVNEPKNSPDLNLLRLVVHGLLNDPVSFQAQAAA